MPTLHEQCDPRHRLKKLGERIPWSDFEEAFGEYYSEEGRPAKPVRLMVGLLLLKQMYDQSDEDVVERWVENPYWQQFCGMSDFQWELPCDPSDLVYFRQRLGEGGMVHAERVGDVPLDVLLERHLRHQLHDVAREIGAVVGIGRDSPGVIDLVRRHLLHEGD